MAAPLPIETETGASLQTENGEALLGDWLDGVPTTPVGPYPTPVIPSRAWPALRRGVNLSHWYQYGGRQTITAADLSSIKRVGFDFVRFPVAPGWSTGTPPRGFGFDPTDPTGTPTGLADVLVAVEMIIASGLVCLLDFHSIGYDAPSYSWDPSFWRDPEAPYRPDQDLEGQARPAQEALIACWTQIAAACAHYPQAVLAFEICNEPAFWEFRHNFIGLRDELVAAIRTVDPLHLIVTPSHKGGGKDGLWMVPQVGDRGTAYAVHNYDPMWITTNMADWLGAGWPGTWFSHITWPPSAMRPGTETWHALRRTSAVSDSDWAAKLASMDYPQAGHDLIARYCAGQDATPDSLRAMYRGIGGWPWCSHLKMVITEFGVARYDRASSYTWDGSQWLIGADGDPVVIDEASRSALLHDHRVAIEAAGMGWAVWDLSDYFGVARRV